QHATRVPGATGGSELLTAIEDLDVGAAFRELHSAGESRYAGANDADLHGVNFLASSQPSPVSVRRSRRLRRGTSRTSRASLAAWLPRALRARCASSRTSARTSSRSAPPCEPPWATSGRGKRKPCPGPGTD